MSGSAGGGNRQDNRQRGNAAQLLEKYKSLARDAQLAGDRVQTEYYLQFADHYFRVLEDSRSRFEQQEAQRRPRRDDEEFETDGDEEMTAGGDSGEDAENSSSPNELGFSHGETEIRQQSRRDRERGGRDRFERNDRSDRGDRAQQGRANGARRDEEPESEERIALGVLPPAIGASDGDSEEVAAKPRRRGRKPRADDDGEEIAPAASLSTATRKKGGWSDPTALFRAQKPQIRSSRK